MADFSMFGPAEGGQRLAAIDQQAMQLQRLTAQKTQAETEHYKAQAAQELQKAATEKQQAEQKQKQAEMLQRVMQQTQGKSLQERSKALLDGGLLEEGVKTAEASAKIINDLASADAHKATADEKQYALHSEMAGTFAQIADMIPLGNQKAYTATLDSLEKSTGIKFSEADRAKPWNEETRAEMKARAMSYKDTVEAKRKQAKDESDAKLKDEEVRLKKIQETVESARADEIRARTSKMEKVGGKNATAARTPREDVKAVTNMAKADFPDMEDTPASAAVAELVAGEAQSMLKKNPGLSRAQALSQAYGEAKKNGMIKSHNELTKRHFWSDSLEKKSAQFTPTKKESKVTTEKPAGASDADWAAYKKEMGIK